MIKSMGPIKYFSKRHTPSLWVIGLTLLVAGILVRSSVMGSRLAERHAPQIAASHEIKIEIAIGHLWFEEIISEDFHSEIEAVWSHFDEALWYATAMLEGGENDDLSIIPLRDPQLCRELEEIQKSLVSFRGIAEERWAAREQSGIGSDIDQRFDAKFEEVSEGVSRMESALQAAMTRELWEFKVVQGILVALCLGLGGLGGCILNAYEKKKRDYLRTLHQSEENLSVTLNSIGDAVISVDIEGRVAGMNPVAEALTGWPEAKAITRPLDEVFHIIHAQTHKKVEAPVEKALREGIVVGLANHTALIARDGTEYQIADSAAPIRDAQGTILGVVLVFRDVTEEYAKEKQLRENEKKYRKLIEASRDGYAVVKGDGKIVMANASYAEMLGYSEEEMKELSWIEFTPEKWREEELGTQGRMLLERGYTDLYQKEYIHRDGHVFPVEVQAYVLEEKENFESSIIGAFTRDITNRKQVEVELRESEARFRTLFEEAPLSYQSLDENGNIIELNETWCNLLGYTKEEALGRSFGEFMPSDFQEKFLRSFPEFKRRGFVMNAEFEMIRKDGSEVSISLDGTIGHKPDGSFKQTHCVLKDVTEQKSLEEQFRQAQKMESIGQLVGGVAHDFNNLLQIINGYAYIARAKLTPKHAASESIEEIAKAGEHAKVLVKQLLAFSRQQVIDPVDLDLNEEIGKSQKMLRHLIGEHIEFEFIAGEDVETVFADKGQMQQVLMNLCVNARDAMPDGGTLRIETKKILGNPENSKKTACAPPGWHVCLSVSDTGFGMNKETCDRIFEPFFTTKEVGEGTGLGLSTVYGIVKQNEGTIKVSSEPGEGTTFKIYLPVSNPLSEETLDLISDGAASVEGGIETLLVVEDEEAVLELATYILRDAGYTILIANDGDEAVRVFEEHADEIDCVIMDVVMPRMGGKEAMEKILKKRPALRHLFVSGYSPDAGHTDFIKEQGEPLLSKPYRPAALLQKVRAVLDED